MKKTFYLCLVFLSTSLIFAKKNDHKKEDIDMNQDRAFVVRNLDGDISIEGTDLAEPQLDINKRNFGTYCYVNIEGDEKQGMRIQVKKNLLSFFKKDTVCLADIKLSLPKESNLYLETEKGDIYIKNIKGKIAVEVNRGRVELTHSSSSSLLATLAHGDLEIKNSMISSADINLGLGKIDASLIASPNQKPINIHSGMSDIFIYLDRQTGVDVHFESGMGEFTDERIDTLPSSVNIPFKVSLGMGSMSIKDKID